MPFTFNFFEGWWLRPTAPSLPEGDQGGPVAQNCLSHAHRPGQAHEEIVVAEQRDRVHVAPRFQPRAILADPHHQNDEKSHPCQARQHLNTEHLDPGKQKTLVRPEVG